MIGRARRRWLAPAVTLLLLVLGTAALTLALALSLTDGDEAAEPASSLSPSADPPPEVPVIPEAADGAPSGSAADRPVAELADPAWVSATSRTAGVPRRALAAYAGAALVVADTHPTCGLGWNTLAAIGQVESEHGTIDGASVDDSGDTSPPIFGVALDGDGVARIRDTDGGRIDQDPKWDRAVGPMQFIPSTWETHAIDGNGDGEPDVHHIDDAVLTAASYLCSAGSDLTQPDSWIAAIATYNPGTGYNNQVADVATALAKDAEQRR